MKDIMDTIIGFFAEMGEVEILGLSATVFVLISFLMSRAWIIRVINIIGAALFVVYGLMINAWSVWLLNGVLILIHLYFLFFKRKPKKVNDIALQPYDSEKQSKNSRKTKKNKVSKQLSDNKKQPPDSAIQLSDSEETEDYSENKLKQFQKNMFRRNSLR